MDADIASCAALTDAMRAMRVAERHLLHALPDLAVPGTGILGVLALAGDSRVTDVAHHLHVDDSDVSRRSAALVADGALVRVQDPADGRAHLLRLTPLGRARWERARERVARELAGRLDDWSPAAVESLAADITRLAADIARDPAA